MKAYWVIYEESNGQTYEDERFEIKAVMFINRDDVVLNNIILNHPEAVIIFGERQKFGIVPEHIKWDSEESE